MRNELPSKQFNNFFFSRRTSDVSNLHNPTYDLKSGDLELSQEILETYQIYLMHII